MNRYVTVWLPREQFDALFSALDMLRKIDRGRYASELIPPRRPAKMIRHGLSSIYIHYRPDDLTHVATTHIVRDRNGMAVHRHGEDLLVGEVKILREREQDI
ncbi:MAG: hypothetical protein NTZ05_22735 [Chloroflexi bacterium]|nr:hypothetical protein [Chloroflexota bacterium]